MALSSDAASLNGTGTGLASTLINTYTDANSAVVSGLDKYQAYGESAFQAANTFIGDIKALAADKGLFDLDIPQTTLGTLTNTIYQLLYRTRHRC